MLLPAAPASARGGLRSEPSRLPHVSQRAIAVGRGVWVGASATVLDGVTIGDRRYDLDGSGSIDASELAEARAQAQSSCFMAESRHAVDRNDFVGAFADWTREN